MNTNEINLKGLSLRCEISKQNKKISLQLLDQTLLPFEEQWIEIKSLQQMIEAIKSLRVRGAPLIGVAASLMMAKLALENKDVDLQLAAQQLYEARPTAVNLMICIDRMRQEITKKITDGNLHNYLVDLAVQIFQEDVLLCEKIAENGADLICDGDQIITHCNTGGLATAGVGTALGIIRKAYEQGKKIHVYVDETRPLLQGGRLTAWELNKLNIPCTLITDSMAAQLMSQNKITKAFVGSDRIARNGDFANKIGTYSLAVNCFYHNVPFYVAAPYTTIDFECESGAEIPIEQRKSFEVRGVEGSFGKVQWALDQVNVYNPAFDVTPARLVSSWVLDAGTFDQKSLQKYIRK